MATGRTPDIYERTLAVFEREGARYEPLTTPEVADALDANRRTVYKRLRKLAERGDLETKATGSNSRVWWRRPTDSPAGSATALDGEPGTGNGQSADRRPSDSGRDDPGFDERARRLSLALTAADAGVWEWNMETDDVVWSDQLERLLGLEPGTFEGTFEAHAEYLHPADVSKIERRIDAALGGDGTFVAEFRMVRADGEQIWVEGRGELVTDGAHDRMVGITRDITEKKRRERALERQNDLFAKAQDIADVGAWERDLTTGESYLTDECMRIHGLAPDDDLPPERSLEYYHADDRETVRKAFERAVEDGEAYDLEVRLVDDDGRQRWVRTRGEPQSEDGEIVRVRGTLQDITNRKEREQRLERQREQLAALNELHVVFREITDAVLDRSTRETIEQAVCNGLADSDSYSFARICAVESVTGPLEPRAEAGVDEYVDRVPVTADPDEPVGRGPTGRAVRTHEIQVSRDLVEDGACESVREHAREHGVRSHAAVPIVHDDALYGVVGVYTERTDAFAPDERDVLAQLGEVVGHAIASVDRKRALLNDEVVELELRIRDLEQPGLRDAADGTVVFDRFVPTGDGAHLVYGRTTTEAIETVRELVDAAATPYAGPVNVVATTDRGTRFELRLSDGGLVPVVLNRGGSLCEARIEDGTFSVRVRLPPTADVRSFVEAVRDTYPETELRTRRQRTRTMLSPHTTAEALADRLTERQRAALEAGYYAGFFDWPRDTSGEEVAASLGISPSTFHQHLRKAEKKLLDVAVDGA